MFDVLGDTSDFAAGRLTDGVSDALARISDLELPDLELRDGVRLLRGNRFVRGVNLQARAVQRQAWAGMLWSKQYYYYDVRQWLRGDPTHPAWFLNLRDNPAVEVAYKGGPKQPMRARIASAEERARLWPIVTEKHKNYAGYQKKTDREIPLVLLEPS